MNAEQIEKELREKIEAEWRVEFKKWQDLKNAADDVWKQKYKESFGRTNGEKAESKLPQIIPLSEFRKSEIKQRKTLIEGVLKKTQQNSDLGTVKTGQDLDFDGLGSLRREWRAVDRFSVSERQGAIHQSGVARGFV